MKNFPYIDQYEFDNFIRPSKLFKSSEELKEFLDIVPCDMTDQEIIDALKYMLELCEEDEAYEYCSIIKSYLK